MENTPARRRLRLGVGAAVVLVVATVVISVVIGVIRSAIAPVGAGQLDAVPLADGDADVVVTSPEPTGLFVHVSGSVESPGIYRLAPGARVIDAVTAAGGFSGEAVVDAINLARAVTDGEQLHVPRDGEDPPSHGAASESAGTAPGGLVDLNSADAATLETLPRIGPALAERIIAWREANGRFTSVDDLLAVPGIGEKILAGFRDQVTV